MEIQPDSVSYREVVRHPLLKKMPLCIFEINYYTL